MGALYVPHSKNNSHCPVALLLVYADRQLICFIPIVALYLVGCQPYYVDRSIVSWIQS